MIRISLLSIAFALGMTSAASGDDAEPYQPVHLPSCEVFRVPGVGDVCGYRDVASWRAVLRVDADLTEARAVAAAAAARADAETERAAALAAALKIREGSVANLQRSLAAERAALKERDRQYQHEIHRPRWGTWLAWGVAVAATGVAIGVTVSR